MFDFKKKHFLPPTDRCESTCHPYHPVDDCEDDSVEMETPAIRLDDQETEAEAAAIHLDDPPSFSAKTRDGHTWICAREEDLKWANLITVVDIRCRNNGSVDYAN